MPTLLYATDALTPHMSAETLKFHHGKHLRTYVDNLNKLVEGTPYEDLELEEIVCKASGSLFNNAAQVWNHIFFFDTLTPFPSPIPEVVDEALHASFGSMEHFRRKLFDAAMGLFGSGWVWLVANDKCQLTIIVEPNAGTPITKGYVPLLTVDVWEHAYYIDHRNRRADYLQALWQLFDWQRVAERMAGAQCNIYF